MTQKWTELTEAEIDSLEGDALSWAVGEAMGIPDVTREIDGKMWSFYKMSGPVGNFWSVWQPHIDANQALSVWAAAREIAAFALFWQGDLVTIRANTVARGYVIVAEGAHFCESICRAYLRVKRTAHGG